MNPRWGLYTYICVYIYIYIIHTPIKPVPISVHAADAGNAAQCAAVRCDRARYAACLAVIYTYIIPLYIHIYIYICIHHVCIYIYMYTHYIYIYIYIYIYYNMIQTQLILYNVHPLQAKLRCLLPCPRPHIRQCHASRIRILDISRCVFDCCCLALFAQPGAGLQFNSCCCSKVALLSMVLKLGFRSNNPFPPVPLPLWALLIC